MSNKKILILGLIAFVFVLAILLIRVSNQSGDIDSYGPEGTVYDSPDLVIIKDPNKKLTSELLSTNYKLVFSRSMRQHAEKKYSEYTEDSVIGFLVSRANSEQGRVEIVGRYGESESDEVFYVTKLNKDRIRFEYKSQDSVIFDDQIEENSKRNQYIGKLPIENSDFSIDYSEEDNTFLVTILSSSQGEEKAVESIKNGTGTEDISTLNIQYLGRAGMPSPYW